MATATITNGITILIQTLSGNAYSLPYNTTSGEMANLQILGIGDFDADGAAMVMFGTVSIRCSS